MNNLIKYILIALSIISGLLFVAALGYSIALAPNLGSSSAAGSPSATPTGTAPAKALPSPSPPVTTAGDLTWNGLKIEIADIDYQAWPLIKAQNSNNEPPLEGMTMILISVRVTNVGGDPEEPVALDRSDFQLVGERNAIYQTFRMSCGVVPDDLDGLVPLGGSMDGKICFQAPADEGGFELIYETIDVPAVYFQLPSQTDTTWTPPAPPPPLLENESLTRDGLKIDIAGINYNAWPLIKAHNYLNDPPLDGMTMLLITLRVTNVAGAPEEPVKLWDSDFKLVGSRKTMYETYQVSCGVIPDELNGVVAPGHFFDANICFQISTDETDFQLIYAPSSSTPAVYFDLPQREQVD